jgi:hypothetical protein
MSDVVRDNPCSVKGCLYDHAHNVAEWFPAKALCYYHYELAMRVERELPLAIQELHALALIAPVVQSHGSSIFQDWWPRDIRDIQRASLARVIELRKLEAELKGENS